MPLKINPKGAVPASTGHRWAYRDLKTLAEAIGDAPAAKSSFAKPTFSLPRSRRGRTAELTLNVHLRMRMPIWTKRSSRPKAEQDEWDRFYKALRYHEDGHIALYRREFPKTFERLNRVVPDEIEDTLAEEVARILDLDEKYDDETQRGTIQETPLGTTVITPP